MAFFLDEINECLWDRLGSSDKKIVLYGMGDGAEKIKAVLDEKEIPLADIMAAKQHSFTHPVILHKAEQANAAGNARVSVHRELRVS